MISEIICRYIRGCDRAAFSQTCVHFNNAALSVNLENATFVKYLPYMHEYCVNYAGSETSCRVNQTRQPVLLIYAIKRGQCDDLFMDYNTFIRVIRDTHMIRLCRLKHAARGSLDIFRRLARIHNDFSAALIVAAEANNTPVVNFICSLDHTHGIRLPDTWHTKTRVVWHRIVAENTICAALMVAIDKKDVELIQTVLHTREYLVGSRRGRYGWDLSPNIPPHMIEIMHELIDQ